MRNNTYEEIREVLKSVVQLLVDKPEEVTVEGTPTSGTFLFEVKVGDGEVGKVLGRGGRIANAIRQIIISVGAKNKVRCIVDIVKRS